MDTANFIGLVAGFLTTISIIPQIIKIHRSRSAADISLGMYIVYSFGVLAWLLYGIIIENFPLVLWNGMGLILACTVLVMKINFSRSKIEVK